MKQKTQIGRLINQKTVPWSSSLRFWWWTLLGNHFSAWFIASPGTEMKKKFGSMLIRKLYTTGDFVLCRNAIRSNQLERIASAKVGGMMRRRIERSSSTFISPQVFGLGNKTYEHYNKVAIYVDKRLEELGATRVFECGLGDDDAK